MRDVAGGANRDHRFAAEQTEFLAVLRTDTRKERCHAVVVTLAVLLERMMVALRALQPHAQKQLRRRFGQRRRIRIDAKEIGWTIGIDRTLCRHQFANELIVRLVGAKRFLDPVVQRPHPLFAKRVAVVANQVRPFQCPVGGVLIVERVERRVTGQTQQSIDKMHLVCSGRPKAMNSRTCSGDGSEPMQSKKGSPNECRIVAQGRWLQFQDRGTSLPQIRP